MSLLIIRTVLEGRRPQAELPGLKDYAHQAKYRLIPGLC
jgi:hypothetical protein